MTETWLYKGERKKIKSLIIIIFFYFSTVCAAQDFNSYPLISFVDKQDEIEKFLDLQFEEFSLLSQIDPGYTGDDIVTWSYPSLYIKDDILGLGLRPNTTSRMIMRESNRLVFDSTITIDEFSRRVTPRARASSHKRALVLTGCSWTFGFGLSDDQTINHYVSEMSDEIYPFNYGYNGGATNISLELVRRLDPKSEIGFEEADLIYVYMASHLDRTIGTLPSYNWMQQTPYFLRAEKGHFEPHSPMSEVRPWRHRFLTFFDRHEWLWNRGGDRIFPRMMNSEISYVCDLVGEMKRVWEIKYPKSRFFVYLHPMSFPNPRFETCLKQRNISTFQGEVGDLQNYVILGDGHPNQLMNREVATQILKFLDKLNL
jgi:hypothetical protein